MSAVVFGETSDSLAEYGAEKIYVASGDDVDGYLVAPKAAVLASLIREKQPAAVGTLAHMNDQLRTGAKARLQVSFRDSTQLNLGENATVVVDRFVYNPDASSGEVVLKTGVAAFRMATGKISELTDKKITVTTPFATIGVRGTDFWWGPIDGHFGVLMLSESKVEVRNEAGAVLLDKAGYGTDIDPVKGGNGAPSRPYKWDAGKVERATSQTNVGLAFNPVILAPAVIPAIVIPELQSEPSEPSPRTPDSSSRSASPTTFSARACREFPTSSRSPASSTATSPT